MDRPIAGRRLAPLDSPSHGASDPAAGAGGAEGAADRDIVNALSRGMTVLGSFSRSGRKMTLSEVAVETGMSRAAARRFLLTLVRDGYVASDGKYFDLTPKVLDLGFSVLARTGLWDRAWPFLDRLADRTGESCAAVILDGLEAVCVAGVQNRNLLSVDVTVGARQPAFYSAGGRVLLAGGSEADWDGVIRAAQLVKRTEHSVTNKTRLREIFADVSSQGWCLVDQELELGLLSIAVPLHDRRGALIGAIEIAAPTVRATPEDMVDVYLPCLCVAEQQIRSVAAA